MREPTAVSISGPIETVRGSVEIEPLDTFVREHYPRLVRLAGLITRDVEQAQDAVQAALERAWRNRRALRDQASLRGWLDQIVVREAIRQTRGRGLAILVRRPSADWVDIPAGLPEPAERAMVRDALGRLSPDHRAVLALHLHVGYSVDETARILGVPSNTVRSRLRAARAQLRRDLGEVTP